MSSLRSRLAAALAGVAIVAGIVAIVAETAQRDQVSVPGALPPVMAGAPTIGSAGVACPVHPGTATRAQTDSFPAVAVVWCSEGEKDYRDGQWSTQVKQVSRGSVAEFLAALDRPDGRAAPGTMCAAYATLPPDVALVASNGRTIAPRFPVDGCGHIQERAESALRALHYVTVSVRRLQLMQSTAAVTANCAMRWKNENEIDDSATASPGRGGSGLVAGPLRVCWYRTGVDPEGGDFVRGATLSLAASQRLRAALSGGGATGSCPTQHRFAVVFDTRGAESNVELGGCFRVHTAFGTGRADRAVVSAVLG